MRHLFKSLFDARIFYIILLVINFVGIIWGFWWYRPQFTQTPLYLWLFLPNSPLAVLYFFIVLLLLRKGMRAPLWEGLAYFGLLKHGFWTVVIISIYYLGGSRQFENILLWGGHLGMALQAVIFWIYFGLPLRCSQAITIAGWYFFNDYLDYGVGIYPRVDTTYVSVATIRGLSISFSIIISIIMLISVWKRQKKRVPSDDHY
ncbi:MAG: DUF1405 domain-containing protein, partial [Firmicutes bacterium]|nr:DUF1405 domain-containing protein [Bacillota bacterium]